MTPGLVSVITPTWQRHEALLSRCVPSVAAQDWPQVEHLVISDGPDEVLRAALAQAAPGVRYAESEHGGHWGHNARLLGLEMARGEFVAYLDDDDAYRPQHCRVLAAALQAAPEAGFAWSQMVSHEPGGDVVIGGGRLAYCQVGTPMIFHRRELADVATWERSMPSIDWDLVSRWLAAGVSCVHVPEPTADVWPSRHGGM